VAHAYNPSYLERLRSGGSWFEASLTSSLRLHLQNHFSKIGWRCGSSGRTPALQMQNPELTSGSCPPKNQAPRTENYNEASRLQVISSHVETSCLLQSATDFRNRFTYGKYRQRLKDHIQGNRDLVETSC
jgi:hypothetical protein